MAFPAIAGILSSVLSTAMGKQNAETGHIQSNQYATNAKKVAQLMKGE